MVSRPGYSPSTHTHISPQTHSSRELLPWEPTPLWLFPSQEKNRHQSVPTSRFFYCQILSFFSCSGCYKLSAHLITWTDSLFPSLLFPPVSLLSSHMSLTVMSLSCIIYPQWDLYISHKWKAKHYFKSTCTKTCLGCFCAVAKETWWKKACHFKKNERRISC